MKGMIKTIGGEFSGGRNLEADAGRESLGRRCGGDSGCNVIARREDTPEIVPSSTA